MRLRDDVEERNLADRRGDAPVRCRRRQRVAAAHRGAEGRDPLGVDARQGASMRDRRAPVLELARRMEEVRLSRAVAEPAVIEDERREARRRETLGEGTEAVTASAGEAVGHDDDRRIIRGADRRIEPGRAGVGAGGEGEILAAHAS